MNPKFLCLEEDPEFEPAVRKGGERPWKKGRQYLANFFGPRRDTGGPIPLIYFVIQTTDPKKLQEQGGVDKIFAAAREVPALLGIDPIKQVPLNNFQQPRSEGEALQGEAIHGGYGLSVMQQGPCGAAGLVTPYLNEIQETPDAEYAVILATVNCLAHNDAVEGSEQVHPAGDLDCSNVMAMDGAGRVLLEKTMGKCIVDDT